MSILDDDEPGAPNSSSVFDDLDTDSDEYKRGVIHGVNVTAACLYLSKQADPKCREAAEVIRAAWADVLAEGIRGAELIKKLQEALRQGDVHYDRLKALTQEAIDRIRELEAKYEPEAL